MYHTDVYREQIVESVLFIRWCDTGKERLGKIDMYII